MTSLRTWGQGSLHRENNDIWFHFSLTGHTNHNTNICLKNNNSKQLQRNLYKKSMISLKPNNTQFGSQQLYKIWLHRKKNFEEEKKIVEASEPPLPDSTTLTLIKGGWAGREPHYTVTCKAWKAETLVTYRCWNCCFAFTRVDELQTITSLRVNPSRGQKPSKLPHNLASKKLTAYTQITLGKHQKCLSAYKLRTIYTWVYDVPSKLNL